jgi:hypothetical protein
MSEQVYLLTLCLPLATVLLVFGMRYFAMIQQARARIASETNNAAALAAIQSALADIATRMAGIEKILKDVG